MSYFDQAPFDVRSEWGQQAIEQLASSDVIVVVDVLSFSTCVDIALERGVAVLPYRWADESAASYATEQHADLASTRSRLAGQHSLSPSSLLKAPPGLRLVLPSPNGSTLAFRAAATGAKLIAGCLRNCAAVAAYARSNAKTIAVIPAGERWADGSLRVALEDLWGAGAILGELTGTRSPEAQSAVAAFKEAAPSLLESLKSCASGRELVERGFVQDVELAAQLHVSRVVPMLQGKEFVDVAV